MNRLTRSLTAVSFVLSFLLCIVSAARSAPIWNLPQKLVQPDGSIVHCFASGDEFNHWLHDKDNYTIIQHPVSGYFVYALLENGILVPSTYVVGKVNPMSVGLTKGVHVPVKEMTRRRETFMNRAAGTLNNTSFVGSLNNLVIFIRFADEEKSIFPDSTAKYDSMFNSHAAGANSMFNYYKEASYNKVAISTTFYPHAEDSVLSYQDAYPRNYYRKYNSVTNPSGYTTDAIAWARECLLLKNAVDAVASQIPAELNIDLNGDGYVDNVCFIASGDVDAWADLLWPHMKWLPSNTVLINGKQVRTFNFQLRNFLLGPRYVGVLCHEMFHSFGSPDLYHYINQDELWPVWKWDIMEHDLNPPQHMSAYMKYKYGKWIDSIPTIMTPGTFKLSPLTSSTNNCYKIPSEFSSTEYFVVEYRKKIGTFESSLPGEGLLVYRINTKYEGNGDGPPDEVYVYRPGGRPKENGTPDSAAYSANSGRVRLNDFTNPSCFLSDSSLGGLNLINVGFMEDTISFTLGPPIVRPAWKSRLSGTTNDILAVSFVNAHTGTAIGRFGTILRTTNGGETWTSQTSGTTENLYGVSFADANTGTAVGLNGTILRTTNGGETWSSQSSGTTDNLFSVSVFDVNTATAVTGTGTILHTTDNWATCTSQPSGTTNGLRGLSFTDANRGTAVGFNGTILRTTNGGEMWTSQTSGTTNNLYGVCFTDANTGTAVGLNGTILRTTNGGDTWTSQTSGRTNNLYSVSFTDANTGTAVGLNGTILRTTNGGETWTSQSSGITKYLYGVSFTGANTGTAVGGGGTILCTTTGGVTWAEDKDKKTDDVPTRYTLSQNYPNPFNPTTVIEYQIPNQSFVTLKIFDLLGREVATLVNERKDAGTYSVQWNASGFSSGIYFYRLEANEKRDIKKMVLMK
jgi:M6 family metalloprotease-like protein